MKRVIACMLVAAPAASLADSAESPPTFPPPQQRPITEVDVYKDMADFWVLAGLEQSVIVGTGGGYQHGGVATLDVAFRRPNLHSAWDLLPTTLASGVWLRDEHAAVPMSIGWQIPLGLFSAPYVVADAVGVWTPAASRLDAGFDVGLGYEARLARHWAIDADVRLVGLWNAAGTPETMAPSPWGVRALVSVRRYFGE